MSSEAKPTPGPWHAMQALPPSREDHGWRRLAELRGGWIVAVPKENSRQLRYESVANADLIVEAGNAYHETGLTPWQLAEQRRELLEALEAINNAFRVDRTAFTEEQEQAVTLMDAALEKATGEKLEPLSEDEIAAV